MLGGLIYVVITCAFKTERQEKERANYVASANVACLASKLSPESTHMDVLFCIVTAFESIQKSQSILAKTEKLKAERLAKKRLMQKDT